MIYRKGSIADFEQLKELGIISYSEYSSTLDAENWKKLKGILNDDEKLKNTISKSTVFVCEKDNEIAGAVYFFSKNNPTELYKSEWCYFRSLGVNPKYRGLGIGNKLTNMCLDYAKETKEKTIALHTSEFMDTARVMYEKKGFERVKEIQRLGKKYWIFTKQL
ncbi:GNAT family N-acetyltransferase [Tenacibaculum sp. S7007]|uniref:GNAT family N-acetyltransferase n=1 Tax=Tenacibaculum pelagium TaxID=2759527 RepID=A0A839ARH5_9FLAO|nr:GNAT family N-acetyltransferase [Tenacibaculum pelagium]MBA6156869.1 GNAT family N-acetyltransferase [Tenacibaculum pelagium]